METPEAISPARLGRRDTTLIDEGEYVGCASTVDQIVAWPLYAVAVDRLADYDKADDLGSEMAAIRAMLELYISRARPVWNVEDLRGPVPTELNEMLLRVPVALAVTLYQLWLATFPIAEPED